MDATFLHVPPSPPIITYNANSSSARCRFSIAHELGHFALSHRPISFSELFGTPGRDSRIERTANALVARALMPKIVLARDARLFTPDGLT